MPDIAYPSRLCNMIDSSIQIIQIRNVSVTTFDFLLKITSSISETRAKKYTFWKSKKKTIVFLGFS